MKINAILTSFWSNAKTYLSNNYLSKTDVASKDTLGGVKTTSTVTSTSGLTATPIIDGVPYYKDTNTTYSAMSATEATTGTATTARTITAKVLNDKIDEKISGKANDSNVVHTSGDETIGGNKRITNALNFFASGGRQYDVFANANGSSSTLNISGPDKSKSVTVGYYNEEGSYVPSSILACNGDIRPSATNTNNLGSSSYKWANVYATSFNGNLVGNADTATTANTATTADKITLTDTNPTSASSYQITFATSTSNNTQRVNNGLKYYTLEGTASANGYGQLFLGNSTADGVAGNKYGNIRLYSKSSNYAVISGNTSLTTNRTLTIPNATGTLICTGNLTTTLGSGSSAGGLSDASIGIGSLVLGYVNATAMTSAISSAKSNGFLNISGSSINPASITHKSAPSDNGLLAQVSYATTSLSGTWRFLGYNTKTVSGTDTSYLGALGLFIRIA